MPHVASIPELRQLERELTALKLELSLCVTAQEIDMLIERWHAVGLFARIRPGGREVLSQIIGRRIAEVEAAENCGDVGAALAEYDEYARMLAQARTMGR